jgi:hypothetical protein
MDVMDLMDNLDNFIIVNNNTLRNNGDKYTNYALYGNEKELTPVVEDYLKEKNINYVLINLKKEEDANIDLKELAKELVDKKGVLLIHGYGNVGTLIRWRFSAIFRDLSVDGIKINYLGTIAFMDKNICNLDYNEEDCFRKIR